jgi:hypothetical protein
MRRGFTDFSANNVAGFILRADAPVAVAKSLMNWRRVVFIRVVTFLVIPGEVEESLKEQPEEQPTRPCNPKNRKQRFSPARLPQGRTFIHWA